MRPPTSKPNRTSLHRCAKISSGYVCSLAIRAQHGSGAVKAVEKGHQGGADGKLDSSPQQLGNDFGAAVNEDTDCERTVMATVATSAQME